MSVLRMCSDCRHRVPPLGPAVPIAPRTARSGAVGGSVNKLLEGQHGDRVEEEQKVGACLPFLEEPRYFPWCRKLTMSRQEAAALRRELLAGDDRRAREAQLARRIAIDFADGVVLPIYAVCACANKSGQCAEFEAR
jgi:hypothetical protein